MSDESLPFTGFIKLKRKDLHIFHGCLSYIFEILYHGNLVVIKLI